MPGVQNSGSVVTASSQFDSLSPLNNSKTGKANIDYSKTVNSNGRSVNKQDASGVGNHMRIEVDGSSPGEKFLSQRSSFGLGSVKNILKTGISLAMIGCVAGQGVTPSANFPGSFNMTSDVRMNPSLMAVSEEMDKMNSANMDISGNVPAQMCLPDNTVYGLGKLLGVNTSVCAYSHDTGEDYGGECPVPTDIQEYSQQLTSKEYNFCQILWSSFVCSGMVGADGVVSVDTSMAPIPTMLQDENTKLCVPENHLSKSKEQLTQLDVMPAFMDIGPTTDIYNPGGIDITSKLATLKTTNPRLAEFLTAWLNKPMFGADGFGDYSYSQAFDPTAYDSSDYDSNPGRDTRSVTGMSIMQAAQREYEATGGLYTLEDLAGEFQASGMMAGADDIEFLRPEVTIEECEEEGFSGAAVAGGVIGGIVTGALTGALGMYGYLKKRLSAQPDASSTDNTKYSAVKSEDVGMVPPISAKV